MIYGEPGDDPRRSGIGGSEAAAVLGVSPWLSRLGLWELKRGLREPDPPSERMQFGTLIEPIVIAEYERRTETTVERGRFLRHPNYDFMCGTPDGLVNGADKMLEVKLTGYLGSEWGEEGTDAIPAHYYAQVQHYMALTDDLVCDVAVLVGGNHLGIWTVPADREFQEAMIEQEAEFWESVQSGEPPAPDGSEDARRALRILYPRAERDEIVATPEMADDVRMLLDVKAEIRDLEKTEEALTQHVMAYMGEHTHLVGDGFSAAWPNVAGRTDWKLVAKAYRTLLDKTWDAWEGEPPIDYTEATLDALVSLHTAPDGRRLTVKGTGE